MEEAEFFKNRKEALNWLQAEGYPISQGKFYEDIKKKGFPALNPDKSVSKYQVLTYGQKLKEEVVADLSAINSSEYANRKEKADADIAEMKAARMRREEDELWLKADVAWAAIAGLVGELRASIRHHHSQAMKEVVLAAGGDVARAPESFEKIEAATSAAFNEVAGKEISIQFKEEE